MRPNPTADRKLAYRKNTCRTLTDCDDDTRCLSDPYQQADSKLAKRDYATCCLPNRQAPSCFLANGDHATGGRDFACLGATSGGQVQEWPPNY